MSWPTVRLKYLADIRVSSVDKKSVEGQSPVRLCNYTDVYYRDTITPDQVFMAATASPEQIAAFRLQPGDVVITKDSEAPDDIGVPAFVADSAEDLICGYHLAILRPNDAIDGRYLHWSMSSRWVRGQLAARATGVTRFGLRTEAIANTLLNVPSLGEQRRIAALLDRETSRIRSLTERIDRYVGLLEERREAVITAAITGEVDPFTDRPPAVAG